MSYRMKLRKLGLVAVGGMLITAPLFGAHLRQQEAPGQTKSDAAKPDQTAQTSSEPNAAPAANSASTKTAPAQIVVPAGTHLPLVLHNGITTRNAQPGEPLYLETTFPVVVNDRIVIPAGSYVQGEITEAKRPAKGKGGGEVHIRLTTLILPMAIPLNSTRYRPTRKRAAANMPAKKAKSVKTEIKLRMPARSSRPLAPEPASVRSQEEHRARELAPASVPLRASRR